MQTGRKQKRVGPKAVYSVLESLHISLHSARCKIMQLLRNTTKLTWPISRDFWNQTTLVTWKIRSPKSFQLLWSQFPGHRSGCASSSCRNLSAWRSGSWTNKRLARLSPLVKSSYIDPLITLNLCMLIVHLLFSWLQRAQHFPQLSIFFHYEKNNIYYIYIRVYCISCITNAKLVNRTSSSRRFSCNAFASSCSSVVTFTKTSNKVHKKCTKAIASLEHLEASWIFVNIVGKCYSRKC